MYSDSANDSSSKVEASKQNITDYTHSLHQSLQSELKATGFDPFANRYRPSEDPLITASKYVAVNMDKRMVNPRNGPTEIRERFTSNYWRKWNKDLNLLENLSKNDLQQPVVIPKITSLRKKGRYRGPGVAFGPSHPQIPIIPSGYTTVKNIIKKSLHHDVSNYHPEVHGITDPYSIGVGRIKGGSSMSATAVAHEVSGMNTTTKLCDCPPLIVMK